MKQAFWAHYISDGTVKAICWTLIHSLWIGLVIALLSGIVIATTRKSPAILRYRLLCGLLLLFVISIAFTFNIELLLFKATQIQDSPIILVVTAGRLVVQQQVGTVLNKSLVDQAKEVLNQNTSLIFMIWLLFFMYKSMKMASGLLYIQRIRNYKTHPVTEDLKIRIEYLRKQMGVIKAVKLVQSELVKVPVAVGWLKPMILLPLGIALQLTPEQIDGILWHELAHIRRRDYLVNILQGLVETVFFFNPGLLWLSSLIRTEREACCDDMVLSRMNQKANYLEALLAFGYGEFKQVNLVMGLGSGSELRDRLRRMISQENKKLSLGEKAILCIGIVLASVFTTLSKSNAPVKHVHINYTTPIGQVMKKTFITRLNPIAKEKQNNDTVLKNPMPIIVRGRDTTIHFTSVLFKNNNSDPANSDIHAEDDKGNKYHFAVDDNNIVSMEINGEKVEESKLHGYDYMVRNIEHDIAVKRAFREDEFARRKALWATKDSLGLKFRKFNSSDSVKFWKSGMEPQFAKLAAMKQRYSEDSARYQMQVKRIQDVIANLVADKIAPDAKAVKWFGLSNTEFIVNGLKQPDALQKRYMTKYGVHERYGLYYGPVEMTGTGVFIDDEDQRRAAMIRKRFSGDRFALSKMKQVARKQGLDHIVPKTTDDQFAIESKGQAIIAEQDARLDQERKKNWPQLGNPGSRGIDLKTPVNSVIADLVDAHVIIDESELVRFNLTNSALMVNGKKQPEDLHERLQLKYLGPPNYKGKDDLRSDPNFGLHYNAKTGETGIGITSELKEP